jgi:large subunit ribosomal protein L23
MHSKDTIVRPLITEKSAQRVETGRYAFLVARQATKPQARQAIETSFGVKVTRIWSMVGEGSKHRVGNTRKISQKGEYKKVIVQLAKDQKIELLEEKK